MGHKLWINGQWVNSKGGGMMNVENPATGEVIDQVTDASAEVQPGSCGSKNCFL